MNDYGNKKVYTENEANEVRHAFHQKYNLNEFHDRNDKTIIEELFFPKYLDNYKNYIESIKNDIDKLVEFYKKASALNRRLSNLISNFSEEKDIKSEMLLILFSSNKKLSFDAATEAYFKIEIIHGIYDENGEIYE
jgi:hypothetical protein